VVGTKQNFLEIQQSTHASAPYLYHDNIKRRSHRNNEILGWFSIFFIIFALISVKTTTAVDA